MSDSRVNEAGKSGSRFTFVDGLRGVAALGVVLYHAIEGGHIPALLNALPSWVASIFKVGGLGVAMFFALSGFVIAHSTYGDRVTAPYVARFMLRRSVRLDPPYWVAIGVGLVFSALSALFVANQIMVNVSLGQLLAHALYLQGILGYEHINIVFWTLCQEVQFYVIYVSLLALSRNDPNSYLHGKYTAMTLAGGAVVSLLWPLGLVQGEPYAGSFLPLWHCFLVGAGSYWAWRNPATRPLYFAFVGIVATAATLNGDNFSLVSSLTALALWAAAVSGWISRALNWSWLQFLGAISYSLYLLHNPITGASFTVGFMLTGHSVIREVFWFVAAILACILAASAMWWLIERPSIRLARSIRLDQSLTQSYGHVATSTPFEAKIREPV